MKYQENKAIIPKLLFKHIVDNFSTTVFTGNKQTAVLYWQSDCILQIILHVQFVMGLKRRITNVSRVILSTFQVSGTGTFV